MAHKALRLLAVLSCGQISLSACSTFEVYDVYVPQQVSAKHYLAFEGDKKVQVSLKFDPHVKFGSAGVFGVPAIPMVARPAQEHALLLRMEMMLHEPADFAFLAAPCLQVPTAEICPNEVTVSALFDSANEQSRDAAGNRTYGRIENFTHRDPLVFGPERVAEDGRIDSKMIFEHYGYRGDPSWIFGVVRAVYTYPCSQTCPDEFVLVVNGLATVESRLATEGTYTFKRTRVRDYEALRPVQ